MSKLAKLELSDAERDSYKEWKKELSPPLPLDASLKSYELYLNHYSCEDIARISNYPLGQVVDARLRYDWDSTRDKQIRSLYEKVEEKVLVTKGQALSHITDMMAAAHKLQGEKIKKFLFNGDETALGDLKLATVKDYRELVNLFVALTNPNVGGKTPQMPGKLKVEGKVDHVHRSEDKQISASSKAQDMLKELEDAEVVDAE